MAGDFDRFFNVPFGFGLAEDGTLIPDEHEQRVAECIRECVKHGVPKKQIIDILMGREGDSYGR